MTGELQERLEKWVAERNLCTKGGLSVMLVITRKAQSLHFPIDPEDFVTSGGGQVAGLGKGAVQKILAEYGITRVLADEGGRTSRRSLGNMRAYVAFLNSLHEQGRLDLPAIEQWWINKVAEHFRSKPFILRMDASKTLRHLVADLLEQAQQRQNETPGVMVKGAVMQHLVGAKLIQALPNEEIMHSGFSVADAPTGRVGDFQVQNAAIHVTTAPTETLMARCRENLENGWAPFIVTTESGVGGAQSHAADEGLQDRVEVLEVTQFVAANIAELSGFSSEKRPVIIRDLLSKYNEIVDQCETDPSLRVKLN